MKERIISLIIVLIMCLTLIPTVASAYAITISIDKNTYKKEEKIVISYSGITAEMKTELAWIGIARQGAPASDYLRGNWDYVNEGAGEIELKAPSENGTYEVRFYQGYAANNITLIEGASLPFTVNSANSTQSGSTENMQTVSIPTSDDFDLSVLDINPGDFPWTGTYETNFGKLSFMQSGDNVTGEYPSWDNGKITGINKDGILYGIWSESPTYAPPNDAGQIVFIMQEDGKGFTGWWRYGSSGSWSVWSTGERNVQDTSGWASNDIAKADVLDLIPDCLRGEDLKKSITRAEFAAVCVKLYEKISGEAATSVSKNPFTDTSDLEVLKAYNVDLTSGTSADKFSPNVLLNREQAATMLTRVFKKAFVLGWTLKSDSKFTYNYTQPTKFADDAKISDWAKPSVYFMVSHGIISGMGNNIFAPKATTPAEQAVGYASATREQALIISVRIAENLGDGKAASEIVPVDIQPTEPVPDEQLETFDDSIVGTWEYFNASGSVGFGIYYDFKEDGTFSKVLVSIAGFSRTVTGFSGKYRLTGNKILLYEMKKSQAYLGEYDDLWEIDNSLLKDIPVDDQEYTYEFTAGRKLVIIGTAEDDEQVQEVRTEFDRSE